MIFSTASDKRRAPFSRNISLQVLTLCFVCVWLWTLTDVADMTNWTMENYPVLLSVGFLVLTYRRLRLSDLSYALVFAFLALHIYGAKYIYAHNPLGEWLKQVTHSPRNNYDRIVHFSFGFLLAYPMRDLFMNGFGWSSRFALWSTVVVALAFGALYEIIEWLTVVLFFPQHGSNFLGLQGDEWDPQKDMLLAALGAACFAVLFALVRMTAPVRFSAHGNTKARQGDSQRFGQKLPETPV